MHRPIGQSAPKPSGCLPACLEPGALDSWSGWMGMRAVHTWITWSTRPILELEAKQDPSINASNLNCTACTCQLLCPMHLNLHSQIIIKQAASKAGTQRLSSDRLKEHVCSLNHSLSSLNLNSFSISMATSYNFFFLSSYLCMYHRHRHKAEMERPAAANCLLLYSECRREAEIAIYGPYASWTRDHVYHICSASRSKLNPCTQTKFGPQQLNPGC